MQNLSKRNKIKSKNKKITKRSTRLTQLELDLINFKSMIGRAFGGSRLKGNPKTKRPFSRKHLIHLILKSSYAKGKYSFLHKRNKSEVDQTVKSLAKRFGIELKDYVNVGNHLHILIKAAHRSQMTKFLRALSGIIPRKILNCEKGKPIDFKFWDGRPFTKIISEGLRPFRYIKKYFDKNRGQATSLSSHRQVKSHKQQVTTRSDALVFNQSEFRSFQSYVEGFDVYDVLAVDTA